MPDLNRTAVATWKLRFRRIYASNTAGLEALSTTVAEEAGAMVTFTTSSEDGESSGAVVTGNKMEVLTAIEELLADPLFLAGVTAQRSRVIIPDFRCARPV